MLKTKSDIVTFRFSVLILGGLSILSSSAIFLPPCEEIPSKRDFNEDAFFNGTWYVTHVLLLEGRYTLHDPRYYLEIEPWFNKPIVYLKYTVISPSGSIMIFTGYATIIRGIGKYVTEFRGLTNDSIQPIMLETIIDTDYTSYALGYYCVRNDSALLSTDFAILNRNPRPKDVHEEVEKLLSKYGLNITRFSPVTFPEKKQHSSSRKKMCLPWMQCA
ncbi:hypothetical protein O3M35_004907 [Rhynocoris fuscipes]|uniref:Lipocalin/cytosolic fatty-acid binding domain-containing protein n=1 Tax=Rhynocoris fuscipes TaxID=488301 RepID=A0AAW1DGA8_9HEMI